MALSELTLVHQILKQYATGIRRLPPPSIIGRQFNVDEEQVIKCLDYLSDKGYIEPRDYGYAITPDCIIIENMSVEFMVSACGLCGKEGECAMLGYEVINFYCQECLLKIVKGISNAQARPEV